MSNDSIPSDLLRVPGFVDELVKHTLATAHRPNRTLALCGALALQAHLAARKVRTAGDVRTNLYLAPVAPAGTGKSHPARVNRDLLHALGADETLEQTFGTFHGIEYRLVQTPALLLQPEEGGPLLGGYDSSTAASLVSLFTAADRVMRVHGVKGLTEIHQPCVNLLTPITPRECLAILRNPAWCAGLLSRVLFVCAPMPDDVPGPKTPPTRSGPPAALVNAIRWWLAREVDEYPQPDTVPIDPDAETLHHQWLAERDHAWRATEGADMDRHATAWGHAGLNALKLALVYAISANRESPRINADAMRWATGFVDHCARWLTAQLEKAGTE